MASVWIVTRATKAGAKRYRVESRVGGADSKISYGGSFRTRREAGNRLGWIKGELSAMRVPDLTLVAPAKPSTPPTVVEVAERWLEARIDVAQNTKANHRAAVASIVPVIGKKEIAAITPADVADLVANSPRRGNARRPGRRSSRSR